MDEDKIFEIMKIFLSCKGDYRLELLDGMDAGLRIAYDSTRGGKGLSREFCGYLQSQPYMSFTIASLQRVLTQIPDICIKETTLLCGYSKVTTPETRPDYIKGMKLLYEIAMQGFLKIIQRQGSIDDSIPLLMIYKGSLELVIRGLRYDM